MHWYEFQTDLADTASRLRSLTQTSLVRASSRIGLALERLRTRPRTALARETQKLTMHAASVRLLDPVTTMARGWSITRDSAGNVITSRAQIAIGETVITSVVDGTITSTVEEVA